MRKKLAEKKKKDKGFPLRTAIILGILVVTALCFLHVKIEHTRTGYQISKAREVEQDLMKESQMLQHEIIKLKSIEHLKPMADKIGFRFPTYNDVVFVEEVIVAQEEQDEGF